MAYHGLTLGWASPVITSHRAPRPWSPWKATESALGDEKNYEKTRHPQWYRKLIDGFTPLKNMKVSWDDKIPNIWENQTCSKPPMRKPQWTPVSNNVVSNSMKSGPFSMALKRGALLGVQLDKVVLLDFAFFPLRRRGVFIDGFHGISPLRRTKHHLKTDLMGFRVQRRIYWFKGVQWSLVLMYTNLMVIWWIIGQ